MIGKHARSSDPISSHLAAADNVFSRKNQILAAYLAVKKIEGATSKELSVKLCMDRYMLARRLPDAEEAGLVVRGESRVCSITLKLALTWYLSPKQI